MVIPSRLVKNESLLDLWDATKIALQEAFSHPRIDAWNTQLTFKGMASFQVRTVTLHEINIAPENEWLDDYFPFRMIYFQGLC